MNKDLVGQTLLKQFRVDAFVESGGMAAVYRVWDLKRNVSLAMKVLHADLADEPAVLRRFQREANALKKLIHPHIVPFYGIYQSSHFTFLLERFVDGFSLKDFLRKQRGKPLSWRESLIYLKALCASLGYAHASGIVHCDVKPGNVMIDLSGSIYLTDFGIARYSESTTTSLGTVGTPAYMAPEQIRGQSVSAETDIYALGVLSFELLTGQRPFRGSESSTQRGGVTVNERIRYGHLNVPPHDPRAINPELSEAIAKVVLRCLNKKASDRFQSTQGFLNELCLAAGVTLEELPDRVAPVDQSPAQEYPAQSSVAAIEKPFITIKKISPRILGGVTLGLLMLASLAIWIIGRTGGEAGSEVSVLAEDSPQSQVTPVMLAATRTPLPTLTPTAIPVINWSNRSTVDSSNNRPGPFLSAGIGKSGKYHIAFFRDSSDELTVVSGDGTAWMPLNNLSQINREGDVVGAYVTLDINDDGFPYLSYLIRYKGRGSSGTGRAGFLTSNGNWNLATIAQNLDVYDIRSVLDSAGTPHHVVLTRSGDVLYASRGTTLERVDSKAFPPGSIMLQYDYFPLALAIDDLQQPCICFSKSEEIQCRYKIKGVWKSVNVSGNGIYPSLQVDEAGSLHLAFFDHRARALKYAFLSDHLSSWEGDTVDGATNIGQYPSLKIDSNGLVHISYYDAGNSALKYAVGQFGRWHTYQVDNDGNVGLISSLVIDLQNNPAIAYYDSERRQIYFIVGQQE